jgi:hypothetical protein
MPAFEVDYEYTVTEWATEVVNADNVEDAEERALVAVKESYPDISNIKVTTVREVKPS